MTVPVAVVGMACRLPGAETLDEYWDLIINGRSAIGPLPDDVLDQSVYYHPKPGVVGKTCSKIGGSLRRRFPVGSSFSLNEQTVTSADLTHVIMCEVAAEAFRHSGQTPLRLRDRNIGVYIGHDQGSPDRGHRAFAASIPRIKNFLQEPGKLPTTPPSANTEIIRTFAEQLQHLVPAMDTQNRDLSANMVAGTIQRTFGLTGTFQAVNAACASSLQALLLACRAIQNGHISTALVGGASWGRIDVLVEFSRAGALSPTGSRPFDADADGVVCSEGFAAIVVKRLDQATADGDKVLAVIRGLGISSDGKGKGIWAPSSAGQMQAIQRAWNQAGNIESLQYIEAHATSTPVGDLTELVSLNTVLHQEKYNHVEIPISSVKANIGHTLETAGLAGLIKTVLCLQNRTIPPATNVTTPTPEFDWEQSSLFLPSVAHAWPAPRKGPLRRAAVNSFGLGGLNAHVILEEPGTPESCDDRPYKSLLRTPLKTSPAELIAVIGCGCLFPDVQHIQHLRLGRKTQPENKTNWPPQYNWKRHKVPPKQIARADPLQFLMLEAVDQAIDDAELDESISVERCTALIAGSSFGGDFASDIQIGLRATQIRDTLSRLLNEYGIEAFNEISNQFVTDLFARWPALLDDSGSFHHSTPASRIVRTYNFSGGACAVDGGPMSGFAAMSAAIDMLRSGDCETAICVVGEHFETRHEFENLRSTDTGAVQRYQSNDVCHQSLSTGAGCLVLKKLTDAVDDGNPIRQVISEISVVQSNVNATTESCLQINSLPSGIRTILNAVLDLPNGINQTESHSLTASGKGLTYRIDFAPSESDPPAFG
ncbi:MAG: hypothetical protein MK102_12675 [Fuerstiella sp.]|nr:hypothetical protein [Fuerstiella sp.]